MRGLTNKILLMNMLINFSVFAQLPQNKNLNKQVFFNEKLNNYKQVLSFDYNKKTHVVNLLYDEKQKPDLYFSDIITPVCNDSLCEILHIRIFWDLSGSYLRFDTIRGFGLTKFDHKPLTNGDYAKLHKILKDKNSILRDKEVDELVNVQNKVVSLKVDAVTSATDLTVAESVVEGAVYSTYTLWHLVNGNASDKIRSHTMEISDNKMISAFLQSENTNYQTLGIDIITNNNYEPYTNQIFSLLKSSDSYIQKKLLKSLSVDFFKNKDNQERLSQNFNYLDDFNKEELLKKLSVIGDLSQHAIETLSSHTAILTYNQAKIFITILQNNRISLNSTIKKNLNDAINQNKFKYGFLFTNFIN